MNITNELRRIYKSILSYLFFGICTTVINLIVYQVCYKTLGISNVISVCTAWCLAVIFAFFTNKIWVFGSKNFTGIILWRECISFFSCRLFTGLFDVLIMYITVDILIYDSLIWKIISNMLVVVLNYITGKLVVFKKFRNHPPCPADDCNMCDVKLDER